MGFDHAQFHGEIIAELEKLRESEMLRVIDSLAVYKLSSAPSRQRRGDAPETAGGSSSSSSGSSGDSGASAD